MSAEPAPTLSAALSATAQRWPGRAALICPRHRMTHADLVEAAGRLAAIYRRLGVGPGDRVACSVGNRCEHLVAMLAAWSRGAVHVATDHRFTVPELDAVVTRTDARLLIYEPGDERMNPYATPSALRRRHPDLQFVVVTGHLAPAEFVRWTVDDLGEPDHGPGPAPDDPAVVFVSSGTTGTPKTTVGFHGNLAGRWRGLAGWLEFRPEDVHLAQLPLSHGFGMMMALAGLLAGGTLVLLDRFSPEDALQACGRYGITVLNGAPAHFSLLLDRLDPAVHKIDTLRFSVGTAGSFPPELVNAIWERLSVDLMVMYGSSEGIGVATKDAEDVLRGSVGRPDPGSVRIVGPDREPLALGEVGEVAFSRAAFPVRYYGEAPSQDAWYYSGDLGRLDEQGRLYIHGRLAHRIDRGGLKVDPVEVERALLRCADVADVAVFGRTDPVVGETVCACVRPAAGRHPELTELRAELSERLAPFKLPEELCLVDEIPRTEIGKVDLPRLRELAAAAPTQRLARR
ncbi:class I adenylate-forming enzyme family protein [Couchioplanes caeruleus]|uniref:AMP ligase n=2 Tax=Couchioplanes caeruleus TaxID=56438 RepID=A0A1K0H3F4_9ACTN|nr:class I adenylate-forming enzyme family protein [Couchioplanes caeruleus]OJF16235.1 AMP ligase [Couchioplanes caeruleus subsp. caeruleus]ROP28788.1 fatty-acyl-CoA synthase/long-chain acyl-CoA synthetase/2,3-dihydroxybenzoate-AMP ligase [Couchioplanes caeruleus]